MVLAMSGWSRRDALVTGGWVMLAGGAVFGGRLVAAAVSPRPPVTRRILPAGPPEGIVVGGRRNVGEAIVLRDERGFSAVSARCTHLGCTVTANARGFECPCHGSAFAQDGRVLRGPATSDLPWYAVVLGDDGELRVDLGTVVEPSHRLSLDEEA
jgi:Rieske Fe-S protein